MTGTPRTVAALLIAGALAAGCSGPLPSTPLPPQTDRAGLVHVHGLGNNPANGQIYAATHTGIFRLGPGGPVRVADHVQDTMEFTVTGPDRFLGSGHPGPADPGEPDLGLIRSDDGGASWVPVSLGGQADFHALSAGNGSVYGWDSASSTVLRSEDSGITWAQGATVPDVGALAVDPDNPQRVLATAAGALLESTDGGTTFAPPPVQPAQPLALIGYAPATGGGGEKTLAGVDRTGTSWTFTGTKWSSGTSAGGPPEAFAVLGPDRYLVATEQAVRSTEDAGKTWTDIAATR